MWFHIVFTADLEFQSDIFLEHCEREKEMLEQHMPALQASAKEGHMSVLLRFRGQRRSQADEVVNGRGRPAVAYRPLRSGRHPPLILAPLLSSHTSLQPRWHPCCCSSKSRPPPPETPPSPDGLRACRPTFGSVLNALWRLISNFLPTSSSTHHALTHSTWITFCILDLVY